MIFAFTEEQKREIEKTGHMVVEVKLAFRRMIHIIKEIASKAGDITEAILSDAWERKQC